MTHWWIVILEYADDSAAAAAGRRRQPVIKATQNVIDEVTSLNLKPDHRGGRKGLWYVAFLAGTWPASPDVDALGRVYSDGRAAWMKLARDMGATQFGLDPPTDEAAGWPSEYELTVRPPAINITMVGIVANTTGPPLGTRLLMRFINIRCRGGRSHRRRRRLSRRSRFVLDFEVARFGGTLTQGTRVRVVWDNNHEFENLEGLAIGTHGLLGVLGHTRVADHLPAGLDSAASVYQKTLAQPLNGQFQLLAGLAAAVHGRQGIIVQQGMGRVECRGLESSQNSLL